MHFDFFRVFFCLEIFARAHWKTAPAQIFKNDQTGQISTKKIKKKDAKKSSNPKFPLWPAWGGEGARCFKRNVWIHQSFSTFKIEKKGPFLRR